MKAVKVHIEETDLALLDRQAAEAGVSRSELIRSRALPLGGFNVRDYHELIALACRRFDVPRVHVERIVTFTFNEVMAHRAAEATRY